MNQKRPLRGKVQIGPKSADARQTILLERERIKRQTIAHRRLQHRAQVA